MTETIQHLCRLYDIPTPHATRQLGGYTNNNFRILTTAGDYVLRISNITRSPAEADFESSLLNYLDQTDFAPLIVPPITSTTGMPYTFFNGKIHTLFPFIAGEDIYSTWNPAQPDEALLIDFAQKSARFHNASPQLHHLDGAKTPLDHSLRSILSQLIQRGLDLPLPLDLPDIATGQTLVHTDLRLRNLIVNRTRISKIIDFDDASFGNPLFDLAWTLNQCFIIPPASADQLPSINTNAALLFLSIYRQNRLVPPDYTHLATFMQLASVRALGFLTSTARIHRNRLDKLISLNLTHLTRLNDPSYTADIIQ